MLNLISQTLAKSCLFWTSPR